MFTIYRHLNVINGKSYIGYTRWTIDRRFHNHIAYSKRNSDFLFHKAIRKYGIECWKSFSLKTCDTVAEARELEKKFIAEYQSNMRDKGYNMTEGGEGNSNKGKPLSPEHKIKAIAALRSHVWTPEEYQERGKKLKGRNRTEEERKAISEGMKRVKQNGLTDAQKIQLERLHAHTRGMKRTEETREKISLSLRGKPKSEQHKQALRVPKNKKDICHAGTYV